jgi:diguanylate cyclase (GGDEF)-like protein
MVVLVETPVELAAAACEKLRQRIAALRLDDLHPDLKGVTVSIGLAGSDTDPADGDLIAQADSQLYRAKAEGRDRLCR